MIEKWSRSEFYNNMWQIEKGLDGDKLYISVDEEGLDVGVEGCYDDIVRWEYSIKLNRSEVRDMYILLGKYLETGSLLDDIVLGEDTSHE